jgi:HEAT repeat protein
MAQPLFTYAYGQRGVPKLAELLNDKSRTEEQRVQTLTSLKNLLSSQEEKCAAISATPSIPQRLAQLIRSETEPVRRLSADCLASLAMVLQGRIAIAEYEIVPSVTKALKDSSPTVRTAAARALHSFSNSRDGPRSPVSRSASVSLCLASGYPRLCAL